MSDEYAPLLLELRELIREDSYLETGHDEIHRQAVVAINSLLAELDATRERVAKLRAFAETVIKLCDDSRIWSRDDLRTLASEVLVKP